MTATTTAAQDSILALRLQLLIEIDSALQSSALDNPTQADRITVLDKQLHDLDMAIVQVRIHLLPAYPRLRCYAGPRSIQ